jgi:hypothetical protein
MLSLICGLLGIVVGWGARCSLQFSGHAHRVVPSPSFFQSPAAAVRFFLGYLPPTGFGLDPIVALDMIERSKPAKFDQGETNSENSKICSPFPVGERCCCPWQRADKVRRAAAPAAQWWRIPPLQRPRRFLLQKLLLGTLLLKYRSCRDVRAGG